MRGSLTLLLLTTTLSLTSAQTTYYVASGGSDANDGRSVDKPFKSLTKVNNLLLQAGDAVLFRRGDTFRGTLRIRQSGTSEKPIRFDAYGRGDKPLLTGSSLVANWTRVGNNQWQAACPDCGSRVTDVYRNGLAQPLGRYPNPDAPNRGSLTVQAHVGSGQLTTEQTLTTNWTGAEVVLRPTYWIIDRATIARQDGNTLVLNNPSTYLLTDGWGCFIQNHPATLDQPGEWYYNPADYTLRIYADQGNPNQQLITATAVDRVIDIADAAFITIQNLHVAHARATNLYALNVSGLTLMNADFTDSGEDGVVIQGTGKAILIDNCTIINCNNNGFLIGPYEDVTFRRSAIRRVGLLPGRGKSSDGQFTGFQSFATQNTLIENNVVDSIGYVGISVQNNTTIRQNLITDFCMTKSDGGGIYLWNGNQSPMHTILIQSNIIRNGIGTFGGLSDNRVSGAHGIFLDDCVQGTDLIDNTIANCQGVGIYLHAVSRVNLLGNTCFSNSTSQLILYDYNGPCPPRNNTLRQNLLVAKTVNQAVAAYISSANDLPLFGSIAHNYYARPFNDLSTIRAVYNYNVVQDLNLSQWKAQFGHDVQSKPSPVAYKEYTLKSLSGVNRISNSFDQSVDGWGIWSLYNNGRAAWTTNPVLDGGSLQISTPDRSNQADSYMLTYTGIRAVTKEKTYLLRFDAAAPVERKIDVFIRQQQAPYQDLTRRYEFMVGPSRKSYEFALTATADEADALLTFQLGEESQPVWFDNIRLQEAVIAPANPDEFIRLVYNPTLRDSTVLLDKPYRDVKNHYYASRVALKPFTSAVLLRDSLPPTDLQLSLRADRSAVKTGEVTSVSLSLRNESAGRIALSNQVQWSCRLPANLMLVSSAGLVYKDSLLTGTVHQLLTDTTFVFRVKALAPGAYTLVAEITATTYADPDSTPDSGLEDGEDDAARITFLARDPTTADTVTIVTATQPTIPQVENTTIYPNPSSDEFTFIAGADIDAIRVVDLLGKERLVLGAAHRGQTIRFGHSLPGAPYLLNIQYKTGEQRSIKLLKL